MRCGFSNSIRVSPALAGVIVRALPFPNDFISEAGFVKNLVKNRFYVMPFLRVEVDEDASIVREKFAEQNEPPPDKFNELRAEHLVTVSLLLILHEVLLGCKRRVNVDEPDFAARAEVVRPLLVGQQFAQGQQIVTPHQQIAPAIVRVRTLRAKTADELPRRGGRLRNHFLAPHFAVVNEPIFLARFGRFGAAGKKPRTPLRRERFTRPDQRAQLLPLRIGELRHELKRSRANQPCFVDCLCGYSGA